MTDESTRARRAVVEMCPRTECRWAGLCVPRTRSGGAYCRLRPPLDEIARQDAAEKALERAETSGAALGWWLFGAIVGLVAGALAMAVLP